MNGEILGNSQCVLQVPLDLIENVLGATSQENGACLGVLALNEVREVLVTDLLDLKKSAFGTDVGLLDLVGSVDNLSAGDSSHSLVVGLSDSSDDRDVVLQQVMGGDVADPLLGDHDIRLPFDDLLAHVGHFVHLLSQSVGHVTFFVHFHAGLTLSLLVL